MCAKCCHRARASRSCACASGAYEKKIAVRVVCGARGFAARRARDCQQTGSRKKSRARNCLRVCAMMRTVQNVVSAKKRDTR